MPQPISGRGTSCTWPRNHTSTGRCGRCAPRSACTPGGHRPTPRRHSRRPPSGRRATRGHRGSPARPAADRAGDGRTRGPGSRRHARLRRPSTAPFVPRGRGGWPATRAGSARRRAVARLDGDAEDRRRDPVADQVAQLLVHPVRLAAELVERVLLGVAAQPDAAAHVVDLGQVLDPQRVDRPQQHDPLDHGPVAPRRPRPRGRQAARRRSRGGTRRSPRDRPGPRACRPRSPRRRGPSRQRRRQPLDVPGVGVLAGEVAIDERVDLLVEEGADGLGQVLVVEDLVALGVDRLALLVDDVVELDDALADVEVEALDAALRALDRLRHEPRLDRDVLLEAEPLHQARSPGPTRTASSGRRRATGRSATSPGRPGGRRGRAAGCRCGATRGARCR